MQDGPTTNASLVLRLHDPRNEAAWSEFVQIYQPMIYSLVRRKGFQDADSVELTQDVLLVVVRAVKRWKPDEKRGSFRGWLTTITRRLMINFLASPARRFSGTGRTSVLQRLLEQPEKDEAESQVFDLELKRRLFEWAAARVKQRVEVTTWEAFWRTAIQGQPVSEVARELGVRPGAVYVAKSRVMQQLRVTVEWLLQTSDWQETCDA
jgi:RNA polymerase sigma-70 factor (ECF subfamily)